MQRETDGSAKLTGDGYDMTKLTMRGNLTIGGGTAPGSICVPTPRFTGEDCHLPARPRYYNLGEVQRHSPEYVARMASFKPQWFFAPMCRCASRNQRRDGAGVWHCLNCGALNYYRMTVDGYLPFPQETALEIDAGRARAWK